MSCRACAALTLKRIPAAPREHIFFAFSALLRASSDSAKKLSHAADKEEEVHWKDFNTQSSRLSYMGVLGESLG